MIKRHEYPKQFKANSAKKGEIPMNTKYWMILRKKTGVDWVLPKIIGSGRVLGTRQTLLVMYTQSVI